MSNRTATCPAESGGRNAGDLIGEIYKKLAQANGICHAITIGKDIEALLSVSDLVEKTKEAFEELWDIYRARVAKPHMNDLTEAEVEKISADLDNESERYLSRAGDLREHWAIMHGTLQRCRGCGELINEDRTVWQELHAKSRAYHPKGSIPSEESLGLFPFRSDCDCSNVHSRQPTPQ